MNTCETCKHWHIINSPHRACERILSIHSGVQPSDYAQVVMVEGNKETRAYLVTSAGFGCNQHEAKT